METSTEQRTWRPKHQQTIICDSDGFEWEVDSGIAPLIEALWARGVNTLYSCEHETADNRAYVLMEKNEASLRFLEDLNVLPEFKKAHFEKIVMGKLKCKCFLQCRQKFDSYSWITIDDGGGAVAPGEKYVRWFNFDRICIRFPVSILDEVTTLAKTI